MLKQNSLPYILCGVDQALIWEGETQQRGDL